MNRAQPRLLQAGPFVGDDDERLELALPWYGTTVLVYVEDLGFTSNSYQLFKRWARSRSTMSSLFARGRIADVLEHRLFLIGADIAQR